MNCNTAEATRQELLEIDPADILQDESKTGKPIKWAAHKAASMSISIPLEWTHPAMAMRMSQCANRLTFKRDWADPTKPGRLHLQQAYFCRVRLCPMCQWRRSLKMYGQVQAVVSKLAADRIAAGRKPYKYTMLTLTVRNCKGSDLSATLDLLQQSWQRYIRRKQIARVIKGYVKAVEITYNRKRDDFHPHIHVLVCVNPSYFDDTRVYLEQKQWCELWREAARLDYTPIVDIRRTSEDEASVAEVTKYATKPGDYMIPSDLDRMAEVLSTLADSCAKRRFAAFGGVMADAHKALGLDDVEDGDLIHTSEELDQSENGSRLWSWDWYVGPRLYLATEKGV